MPDPRNTLSHEGIAAQFATYSIDGVTIAYDSTRPGGSTGVGLAVTLSGDNTVALCADGDPVLGKLVLVEQDGKCNVQFGGMTTLPGGLAAALTLGTKFVGALGAAAARGYIRSVNTAVAAELGRMTGKIQAVADPTNVDVLI